MCSSDLFRATEHVDDDLLILCDSQYVINSVTKWMPGWKRKGWRKGDGKPVMNLDLLQDIDEAIAGRRYRFEWVKGHVGHELNEAADSRARAAAEAYQRGHEVPTGPGFDAAAVPAPTGRERARASVPPLDAVLPAESRAPGGVATLFDLDEPEPEGAGLHELTLHLSDDEHSRLLLRARASGSSPEDLLRRLI